MDLKSIDSVGEAVTYKIREAITNKLIGLGVPFEKELPDYVMVMVANKKSRSQMQEDLFLFLGDGTTEFMDWFEDIMKKFQSNSVKQLDDNFPDCSESKASNLPVSMKGRLEAVNSSKPFTSWQSESDVLTLEVPEQDADFLGEDYFSRSSIITRSNNNPDSTVPGTRCVKVIQPPSENTLRQLPTSKKQSLAAPENSFSLQQKGKIVPCSAVIPVKRPKSALEIDSETVEQPFGSVASVIRVTERKSGVPLALQANKLLLLKAVDAANKSVMAHQKPVKCSKSTYESSVELGSDLQSEKDTRIAVLGEENESSSLITVTRKTIGLSDSSYILAECGHERGKIMCPSALNLAPSDKGVPNDALIHSFDEDESQITNPVGSEKLHEACATEGESAKSKSKRSPRFVVTLDGIDPNTLRRKRKRDVPMEVNSDQTSYPRLIMNSDTKDFVPLDTEFSSTDFAPSTEKKIKVNEKCRYWPACKSGDLCNYHHPTTTCKAFPKCTYGDKCLFIHPNCKFDALCTRKDCPYTHASKRKIAIADVSPKKPSFTTVAPCKYFPNCSSKNCTFFHPRTCWYGSQCSLPSCPYSHTFPVRDQLKWCAP